MAAYLNDDRLV